jgi:hypothetical protein
MPEDPTTRLSGENENFPTNEADILPRADVDACEEWLSKFTDPAGAVVHSVDQIYGLVQTIRWLESGVNLCLAALDAEDAIAWGGGSTFDKLAEWTGWRKRTENGTELA